MAGQVPALYYDELDNDEVRCRLCPNFCKLKNGAIGACSVRKNRGGELFALTYGEVTSAALDPVEKKPLYHFHPGREIYSIGSWGCNLRCAFCQNSAISQGESSTRSMTPAEVAMRFRDRNSLGVAYTYNEPLVGVEFVLDCMQAVRAAGGKNVLVTNGYVNPEPLADLLPLVDAMNIDVKAFNNDFYRRMCGGTLEPVLKTVTTAIDKTHVELTTLLIPNENDAVLELEDLANWIAINCGKDVPCHLTAYHPSYNYQKAATTAMHLVHAREIFRERLNYVYIGNVLVPGASDTACANCGAAVITRKAFTSDLSGMRPDGTCAKCGGANNIVNS